MDQQGSNAAWAGYSMSIAGTALPHFWRALLKIRVKTGGPHHSAVVSRGFAKRLFRNLQGKKDVRQILLDCVFSTTMSYCVLSVALHLERKMYSEVWACSAGIWDGSSTEASHPTSPTFLRFLLVSLLHGFVMAVTNRLQPGKYRCGFFSPVVAWWWWGRCLAVWCRGRAPACRLGPAGGISKQPALCSEYQ